ncbi:GNAT family N-acetyltransferase [Phreatobacter oligotrophus]|jgi:predicted N-acetyltransferase YhbS|uniref:Putative N-acetyltransferase YhbS n=1 Tax=Phreatobacter oligotrophus TaxID=1122261 RepID=A0A2T4Z195_9HYPH|nr:N-acetyltransferase [Phreatobacter oligotrophus]PTM53517.1 putative N-acetyltransferase YhbS [Phreatobacter oligotrophus]
MPDLSLDLHPETPADHAAIERLHERAFGPGRFARTAFRLREGIEPYHSLCFTARVGTLLVGSIRLSPVEIGPGTPCVLLGPITIDPAFQSKGIGGALMRRAMEQAKAEGHRLIMLVGDAPYYERFGFKVVAPGRLALPGPVDPGRLLVAELVPGAFEGVSGPVRGGLVAA